jgi:hypothetical protein
MERSFTSLGKLKLRIILFINAIIVHLHVDCYPVPLGGTNTKYDWTAGFPIGNIGKALLG